MGDSFAKERGFNKDLIEVVAPPNGLKHKLLRGITPEIKSIGIKKTTDEMISNGTTCFMDFREGGLEGIRSLKNALKDSPIKYRLFGRFKKSEDIEQIFKEANGIGFSSYKNVTPQIKERLRECKRTYKKLITTHHAEVKRKEERLKAIIEDGLIDIIVHGTQLSEEDLNKLQEGGISLVLCPRSNGYFGVGFPPIQEALNLHIPVSLGTDNIMNVHPNLFEEMRYLYLIFKVLNKDKGKINLPAKRLLKMVTINAARNFGIQEKVGSVAEGKAADFFLINLNEPNFYCSSIGNDLIYPLIVQRTQSKNIKQVYIRGKKVYERN
jgi:cytosine/adenosine deaminase-related metal-dependent hydrolase